MIRRGRLLQRRGRSWTAAAVIAVLAAVTPISGAPANEASQKLVAEAEALMKATPKNQRQILQKLNAAVRADAGDGRAAFLYGAQLVLIHAARPGLAALDKAQAVDPSRRNLQFFRGRALYDLGRSKDALAAFDRESNKDGNPMFSFYRGLANKALKNYADALADFDKSDAVYQPGQQGAQLHRGDIYAAQGNRAEAVKAYQAAVSADAKNPVAGTARTRLASLQKQKSRR
jgi:tetratricopeptide (TPR) repeat protein